MCSVIYKTHTNVFVCLFVERIRKNLSGCSNIGPKGSVKIMECSNFTKGVFLFPIY